jgi:gliding motility-associated-like protein
VVDLGNDVSLCYPEELLLDAGNPESSYIWSNGSRWPINIAHEGDGKIWVKVTNEFNCSASDTITIMSCILMDRLLIPNAFTPNDDGDNDIWRIGGTQLYPTMDVKVFDRWGRLIFDSRPGYPKPWDGTYNGKLLPMDAFFYIINLGDGTEPLRGSVTIIR